MHQDVKTVLFSETQLAEKCRELGQQLTQDYKNDEHEVVLVGILKGSLPFMADLIRNMDFDFKIDFMAVSSYDGQESSGNLLVKQDLTSDITNKDIVIVEDIIDTGLTLSILKKVLKKKGAHDVKVICLLDKKARRTVDIESDYVGFSIDDLFVIGYGLDYNQKYRNLPYIGILKEECYK